MLRKRYAIAASAGLIIAAFAVYYRVSTGQSELGHQPQVPGRLVSEYPGEGYRVGFTGLCEFDAVVTVEEGSVITEVHKTGSRPVDVGSKVISHLSVGYVEARGGGPSGSYNLSVYWGDDGNLYAGCAPESMAELDDGTRIRITDLPKYGSTPPAAR